jgi:hypothetical protein
MGIQTDLGLVNNEFSLVLILFYIPYGICNIPAALYAPSKKGKLAQRATTDYATV